MHELAIKCSSVRMEPCRWRVQFRGLPKAGIVPDIWQLSPISYVLSSLSELLIGHATSLSGITLAVSVTLTLAVSVTLPATMSRRTFSQPAAPRIFRLVISLIEAPCSRIIRAIVSHRRRLSIKM